MEPDRNPTDAADDTQLLAAIERAWPVPPMTGKLIGRDWSTVTKISESGSFSVPLPNLPVPRFQPRRSWQSLARIAAVLALLLTGVFGVIAFNNRNEDAPIHSIAAPSPYEAGCTLPLRSRDELLQIVTDVKTRIAAGEKTNETASLYVMSYELGTPAAEVVTSVETLYAGVIDCANTGINPYSLRAFSPQVIAPYITILLSQSNQNAEEVVDQLLSSSDQRATPGSAYQWELPDITISTALDGTIIAAEPLDVFGNGAGIAFQPDGDSWQITGEVSLRGEWSTLVFTSNSYASSCSSTSIQSEEVMKQYLFDLGWNENALPLVATLSPTRLENPAVSDADADAIRAVIDDYRDCLGAGIEPYRFAQGSEAFFGIFASFAHAIPSSPIDLLGLSSPVDLLPIIPSAITSIVSIDTNKALAVLATDSLFSQSANLPAIILVKIDGQWLINQLAIVQG
jgi:hypothetical protein